MAGSAAVTVQAEQIATLAVSPASATLAPGATQQLVAVAKDASGKVLTGRVVTWSSSNASVADVSPLGVVFALAAGSTTITATSEGKTAAAAVTVSAPATTTPTTAPLASADFESGTVSPYGDPYSDPAMIAVVNDPTGGRGGKVLRVHYAYSGGDRNTSIEYYPAAPIRSGSLFFRAYMYVPRPTAAVDAIRKLLYWHNDPHTSSQVVYSILYLQGGMLRYDGGSGAHNASVLVDGGTYSYFDRWVRVEQEVKLNTPGVADGELRVWLDGVLVINKAGCRWLDTAAGQPGVLPDRAAGAPDEHRQHVRRVPLLRQRGVLHQPYRALSGPWAGHDRGPAPWGAGPRSLRAARDLMKSPATILPSPSRPRAVSA